jgi:hypothetical protein
MKDLITGALKTVLNLLIIAFLCNLIYDINHLNKIFGPTLTYDKWLAIIAILQILLPTSTLKVTKNDD